MARYKEYNYNHGKFIPISFDKQILPGTFEYTLYLSDRPRILLVSYSWTTPGREQWVPNLATEMRENRVDVIFGKWDLKKGHDANTFIERYPRGPSPLVPWSSDMARKGVGIDR